MMFKTIEAYLLDLDGTVYLGQRLLPGAQTLIELFLNTHKRFLFLTNNSSRDASQYAEKLSRYGLNVSANSILTSGEATVRYLKQQRITSVFPMGTPSFEKELSDAGMTLDTSASENDDVQAVVVGFDTTLTYAKLERGCHLLRRGARFIASHPDLVCPTEAGPIPDCGAICALITAATGKEPIIVGKPSAFIVDAALDKLGTNPAQTAIVGDRLYTDIRMGCEAGIHPILVLSGESCLEDLKHSPYQPEAVFPSLKELAETLRRYCICG